MRPDQSLSPHQMQEIRTIQSPDFHREAVQLINRLRDALSSATEMDKTLEIQDAAYVELSQVVGGINWQNENQKAHDVSRIALLIAQLAMAKFTELSKK